MSSKNTTDPYLEFDGIIHYHDKIEVADEVAANIMINMQNNEKNVDDLLDKKTVMGLDAEWDSKPACILRYHYFKVMLFFNSMHFIKITSQ